MLNIYDHKFSFTVTCQQSKNAISNNISDNMPPNENFEYGYTHSHTLLQYWYKTGASQAIDSHTSSKEQ